MMNQIIGYCGILCSKCPAYIAKQEDNDELRKKTAEEWSKQFDHTFAPEDVNCDGCLATDGAHIGYCSMCEIRKCGQEKQVINCAYCDDYGCEKLEKFLSQAPDAKKRLEEIRANK